MFLVYSGIIIIHYFATFQWLILHDWCLEDYSYCILVPFVVLYILWEKRHAIATLPLMPSLAGFVPFVMGILLFWLGDLAGEYYTLYMSFWFAAVGLLWLHLGWKKIKVMWFALIMMLAMFPFPNFITQQITFQLRLISSKLGVWLLQLYGMSVNREGNVIDIGFTQLQVVDACSGLRYVMPLAVLSLLLAYFFKAHIWKRIVLVISSIPLAIFVNSFRIALTGALYNMFGPRVAESFFHGFSGWLIFVFAIPCLLLIMIILRLVPPRSKQFTVHSPQFTVKGQATQKKDEQAVQSSKTNVQRLMFNGGWRSLLEAKFVVAVGILLLTFGLSHGIEFRQKIPISKSFSQFPMEIGEWKGTTEVMDQKSLDVLKFSDYILAEYKNTQGKSLNFYVSYFQDQRKGEAIHSPETCFPAGGWQFKEAGTEQLALVGGTSSLPVNRGFIEKNGTKELAYFWFPMRGRVLTKLYQIKLYNFLDALTKQRTDGALVRVMTPLYSDEKLEDAEARLQGFTRQVVPVLNNFLPGG